jgi:phospholipase C
MKMRPYRFLCSLSLPLAAILLFPLFLTLAGCGAAKSSTPPTDQVVTPAVTIAASPASIVDGSSSMLTVSATNATQVSVSGSDGSSYNLSADGGTQAVTPAATTTYTASASGTGGKASGTATVTVTGLAAPTVTITANPTSIAAGSSSTLTVTATNATAVTLTGSDSSTYNLSSTGGTQAVTPITTTTYTAVATGPGGNSSPQQVKVTVTVTQALPTLIFSASANSIAPGSTVYLSWQTTNATSVAITALGADGVKRQISTTQNPAPDEPAEDTSYTAVATGPGGSTPPQTVSVTLTDGVPQITQFSATPSTVVAGASTTLTWETRNATSVAFSPAIPQGDPEEAGPFPVLNPKGTPIPVPTTVTYTMVARNSGGEQSLFATATITAVKVNLTASPATSTPNQPVQLSWDVDSSVTALTIDNGGCAPCMPLPTGSTTVTPSATTTYTATASLADGTQLKQTVTVTVSSVAVGKIKHIFFMLQENRSFDSYFGVLGAYRAQRLQQFGIQASPSDVDGFNPNVVLTNHHDGKKVHPFHQQTVCTQNPTPSWDESHHNVALKGGDTAWLKTSQYKSGSFAMNNFLDTPNGGLGNETNYDPEGSRAMGYYNQNDIPYYYDLATFFATSDRWFSPILTATYPNRMYLFAASSFGHELGDEDSGHPQYSAETIFRAMNQANVSWLSFYKDGTFLPNFKDWNNPAIQSKVFHIDDLMNRLAGNCSGGPCDPDKALPEVIFIESASGKSGLDEHPDNNIQKGAAYVQSIINALMNSDAWKDSAFILTYDEGGGLYDHVPPITVPVPDSYSQGQCPDPNNGSYGYCHTGADAKAFTAPTPDKGGYDMFNVSGERLPVMVISPYVKPHYVSHTPMDHTAILAFIEKTFNVPPLTNRDKHWLDNGDMSDFFDFSNPALLSPPTGGGSWVNFLPTQPTTGSCNKTNEAGGFVN